MGPSFTKAVSSQVAGHTITLERSFQIMTFKVRLSTGFLVAKSLTLLPGLIRRRDDLMGKLRDLSKQKPRGNADENLAGEVSRLESALNLARQEVVSAGFGDF